MRKALTTLGKCAVLCLAILLCLAFVVVAPAHADTTTSAHPFASGGGCNYISYISACISEDGAYNVIPDGYVGADWSGCPSDVEISLFKIVSPYAPPENLGTNFYSDYCGYIGGPTDQAFGNLEYFAFVYTQYRSGDVEQIDSPILYS